MIGKKFLYLFFLTLIVSCNSTSSLIGIDTNTVQKEESLSNAIKQRVLLIDSYTSKIDSKTNDSAKLNIEELDIQGGKRIITTNESEKNIVLKNKSIVRVKYKDHLYHNFIKSTAFYYDNDELICIKVYKILPDKFNKATLYQRTIYVYDNKPISDSDESSSTDAPDNLVILGHEHLKNEYRSLN